MNPEMVANFRQAWLAAQGDDFASRMSRQSLRAIAVDVPEFQAVLEELHDND